MMMCLSKWISATLAIALFTGTVAAADTVTHGTVKAVNADNKTFVMTDSANKDHTFKIGDNLVVNRAGKESKSDLKAGDPISLSYDKGVFTWTAHYVLVQDGTFKKCELSRGNIKSYDAEKKELTFTNEFKIDTGHALGSASVRINMVDSKIGDIKIGDHALLIVDGGGAKSTLRAVMVDRAK